MPQAAKRRKGAWPTISLAVVVLAVLALFGVPRPAAASLPRPPTTGELLGATLSAPPPALPSAEDLSAAAPAPPEASASSGFRLLQSASYGFGLFARESLRADPASVAKTRLRAFELEIADGVRAELLEVPERTRFALLGRGGSHQGSLNRYYDPEMGRFVTADPLGYVDGPSMYGFAGYSPANLTDSMGLTSRSDIGNDELAYTWNFGWFDYGHGKGKHKELERAWERLRAARPGEEVRFTLGIKQYYYGHRFYRESLFQFRITAAGSATDRKRQLLYAFEAVAEDFEEYQGEGLQGYQAFNTWYGAVVAGEQQKVGSSFSTEDLFSDLVTFYAVVDGITPETQLQAFGGEIDATERKEFSYLVWDFLLKPRQRGATDWNPVLLEQSQLPTVDELMQRTKLSPQVEGYDAVKTRFAAQLKRLEELLREYRSRYGSPRLPAAYSLVPLETGVAIEMRERLK